MKALLSKAVGGPDTLVLDEMPSPEAKPGWAVVSVKAVGVNFPDVLIIEDKYQFKPARPFAPGGEIAGVVKSIGEGVTHVKPGDRVLGNTGWGGMAEELALEAHRLVKIPDAMPYDDAAAFIMTYGTSWHALKDRADLQPGQSLLVLGAAGGVGLAAVELGKAMGARVIAAASSDEKLDVARRAGADEGINYSDGELKDKVKALTNGRGVDVIYDPVGGDLFDQCMRSINWRGRVLVVGFVGGYIPKVPINLILLKGCQVVGVFYGSFAAREPALNDENFREILEFFERGRIN